MSRSSSVSSIAPNSIPPGVIGVLRVYEEEREEELDGVLVCIIERVGRGGVVVGCTRIAGMTGGEEIKMGGLGEEGTLCECESTSDPEGVLMLTRGLHLTSRRTGPSEDGGLRFFLRVSMFSGSLSYMPGGLAICWGGYVRSPTAPKELKVLSRGGAMINLLSGLRWVADEVEAKAYVEVGSVAQKE